MAEQPNRPTLDPPKNPILAPEHSPLVNATSPPPAIHATGGGARHRREIRDMRRLKNARDAIGTLNKQTELYGLTNGQFSLCDLLRATFEKIPPPSAIDLCTWTAANVDVGHILDFIDQLPKLRARWLVDFQKRTPQLAAQIRETCGADSIRVAQIHAKFATIRAKSWRIVIMSSMNLNSNPRFENFLMRHDPALHAFHAQLFDTLWSNQPAGLAHRPKAEITRHLKQCQELKPKPNRRRSTKKRAKPP